MKNKFKIIILTTEGFSPGETDGICNLFKAGLSSLHIRKPNSTKEELRDYLLKIPKAFYKNIVVHSHYELIKEFKLQGAHLTAKSRASAKTINFLKRNKIKIVSTSFHSISEINQSRRKYEYVFLSPVFDSISKKNYKSNFDLGKLHSLLKRKKNIIALGGISDENIETVRRAGFHGGAVLGFIWKNKNPEKNYKKLISKIK